MQRQAGGQIGPAIAQELSRRRMYRAPSPGEQLALAVNRGCATLMTRQL
jgi:hypothetical protein